MPFAFDKYTYNGKCRRKAATKEVVGRRMAALDLIPWSPLAKSHAVLTVWPGTSVKEEDREALMTFFADEFNITPTIVGCVSTLPDRDSQGLVVHGTGGRHDLFFFVNMADVPLFAIRRLKFGMRWWDDIYFNQGQGIYPEAFQSAFPCRAP